LIVRIDRLISLYQYFQQRKETACYSSSEWFLIRRRRRRRHPRPCYNGNSNTGSGSGSETATVAAKQQPCRKCGKILN